jgi:thiamine kinase-like enzyme
MFLINKGPGLDAFRGRFHAASLVPKTESEEVFAAYEQLAAMYPHQDGDFVSSHNDLKPQNIVFDGHCAWLVDWEAAFLNDRSFDLAAIANFVAANDEEERIYLHEYFGQPPDAYQLARFFLMQQLVHLFYAMAYLLIGSPAATIDGSQSAPEFSDFHRRIWTGEVDMQDKQMRAVYGRVHWDRLLRNVRQARFREMMGVVAGQHA